MNNNIFRRVEQTCADLLDTGEQITFTAVAAKTGLARTTLYRNQRLRAVIDDHRTHHAKARTLSSLTSEIAHLRTALEAVAATVRRHEEQLRNSNDAAPTPPDSTAKLPHTSQRKLAG